MLVLDSGGVSFLAKRNQDAVAAIRALVRDGAWPPLVPSVVLVESTTGRQHNDAPVNRLLKTCDVRQACRYPSLFARVSCDTLPRAAPRWTPSWLPVRNPVASCSVVTSKISGHSRPIPTPFASSGSEVRSYRSGREQTGSDAECRVGASQRRGS